MFKKLRKVLFDPTPADIREIAQKSGIDLEKLVENIAHKHLAQMKWDERFLGLAEHTAQWSKDPSTKVGAVIVDQQNRIISVGYNGFPAAIADTEERLNDRETKYELTIHGEMNALLFANQKLDGCTLYTTPLPPCTRCAVMFIQAGIGRVVAPAMQNEEQKKRWHDSIERSRELFEEAGVEFEIVDWLEK